MANQSLIAFLVNDTTRAIMAKYDNHESPDMFKTMDQDVKVGDMIVVQSGTRLMMTTAKVTEVDVEPDFDSAAQIKWAIQTIDVDRLEKLLEIEAEAIKVVQSAEKARKRKELQRAMFEDAEDKVKSLALSHDGSVTE
jgi:hypothetical protein